MLKSKKLLFGLSALVLVSSLVTATVSAHPGHDHSETSATHADDARGKDDGTGSIRADSKKVLEEKRAEIERQVRTHTDTLRQSGDEMLQRLKNEKQHVQTTLERKKACESRKHGLQTKVATLARNAQRYQKRIDDVLSKVQAYQQEKQLIINNYDALLMEATTAQAKSQISVDALAALKPTIDCNNESVARDVASFKVATTQTRTDIAAYRTAVKHLITAVIAAAKGQEVQS